MSKRLVFIGVFEDAWKEVLAFLQERDYKDTAMLDHMKEVLEGTKK